MMINIMWIFMLEFYFVVFTEIDIYLVNANHWWIIDRGYFSYDLFYIGQKGTTSSCCWAKYWSMESNDLLSIILFFDFDMNLIIYKKWWWLWFENSHGNQHKGKLIKALLPKPEVANISKGFINLTNWKLVRPLAESRCRIKG